MENPQIPGELKIGRSNNVELRRAALSSQQNFDMKVVAVVFGKGHLEKKVHRALEDKRVSRGPGQEWFRVGVDEAVHSIKTTAETEGEPVTNLFVNTV